MHDNREFTGVGKTIIGITEHNSHDINPFGVASKMNETNFSQTSNKNIINSIAYGSDGKAFGVIPKETIDLLVNPNEDWSSK